MVNSNRRIEIKKIADPPFSCICTLHYYDANSLLNRPDLRLF
jgi:hypothetical protein